MDAAEKDAVRGLLLDRWLEDLRQDRAPSPLAAMKLLSEQEIEEVLELARFYKATLYPGTVSSVDVDRLGARLQEQVLREQVEAHQEAAAAAEEASSFGAAVVGARTKRQINAHRLEEAIGLPAGTVRRLESGELPPHRLALDTMVALLRALGLASGRVVELIRWASLAWAEAAYARPATQLGRTDAQLEPGERRQLLEAEAHASDAAELAAERERIEQYCQALVSRFG